MTSLSSSKVQKEKEDEETGLPNALYLPPID
jgi:hypothetical protein